MGIYKNDYKAEEDEVLWELHEIRNKLYQELKGRTTEEINTEALRKFHIWKEEFLDSLTRC